MSTTVAVPRSSTTRRKVPHARRGATVEQDESEEPLATTTTTRDSSDSESEPDRPLEDNNSDSDNEDSQDPTTPAATSISQLPIDQPTKAILQGLEPHPSWSDQANTDLPVLDFASLSVQAITTAQKSLSESKPTPAQTAAPVAATVPAGLSKKATQVAKRIAKSDEAKRKDPAAWEVAEKERKDREAEKKLAKKGRLAEKRQAFKAAALVVEEVPVADDSIDATPKARPSKPVGPGNRLINAAFGQPRAPVPSRPSRTAIALAASASASADPSPSTTPAPSAAAAEVPPPVTGNRSQRVPNGPRADPESTTTPYPQAREAYTTRLAADPSFTPRIGRFWGHDERLMEPELRGLTPYWRGRGRGGEPRGSRGSRGRGGMGRGGYVGGNGYADLPEPAAAVEISIKGTAPGAGEGWGRGEDKRTVKVPVPSMPFPAAAAETATSWNHDGFEELKAPRQRQNGPRRVEVGTPGAINPKYAHLPFHPQYRFPEARIPTPLPALALIPIIAFPAPAPSAPAPPTPAAPAPVETEVSTNAIVRLPGSDTSFALPLPLPVATAAVTVEAAPSQVQPADDQSFDPRDTALESAQGSQLQRGDSPYGAVSSNGFPYHQLPPHLQQQQPGPSYAQRQQAYSQQQHQQPQHYGGRHASPVYYPQYYSPEQFAGMHTPGVTPPPSHFPSSQSSAFFVPPSRAAKIEIKAPGPDYSPQARLTPLSGRDSPASASNPYGRSAGYPVAPREPQRQSIQEMNYGYGPQSMSAYDQSAMYYEQEQHLLQLQQQQQSGGGGYPGYGGGQQNYNPYYQQQQQQQYNQYGQDPAVLLAMSQQRYQ